MTQREVWAACFLVALLIAGATPGLMGFLILDSSAISDGQWWRIFTASFTHFSMSHAAINIIALGLLMVWANMTAQLTRALVFTFLASPLLSLSLLAMGFDWYAGLSGILHGLILLLLLQLPVKLRVTGVFLLITKLGWQFLMPGSQLGEAQIPVLHQAHWAGIAIGLAFYSALEFTAWRQGKGKMGG